MFLGRFLLNLSFFFLPNLNLIFCVRFGFFFFGWHSDTINPNTPVELNLIQWPCWTSYGQSTRSIFNIYVCFGRKKDGISPSIELAIFEVDDDASWFVRWIIIFWIALNFISFDWYFASSAPSSDVVRQCGWWISHKLLSLIIFSGSMFNSSVRNLFMVFCVSLPLQNCSYICNIYIPFILCVFIFIGDAFFMVFFLSFSLALSLFLLRTFDRHQNKNE